MRILFAGQVGESLPPLYAGVPKRALLLAKIWGEQGHSVGICFTYRHDHEDDLGANAQYFFEYSQKPTALRKAIFILRAVATHPITYSAFIRNAIASFGSFSKDIILYAAYGIHLRSIVQEFAPDVLVAESGLHRSYFAALVAKDAHIPFVLETYAEVHDHSVLPFASEAARSHFWKSFFSLCDRIIAPSEYCAKGPRTYAPEGLVKMVYATTLDVAAFESDVRTQEEARLRFKVPNDQFIVAAVGSFSPRKGHDHLIEAAAQLRKQGINVGVVLCGEGNPEWLKQLATERGVRDATYFFQNLSEEDLRLLFRSADMYCDASNTPRACLGIALTEALATGIPAIAYDVAGLPEVVTDGETGYLVPVDDIEALAETIKKIRAASTQERAELGANGRIRARKVFDLQGIAELLLNELHSTYDAYLAQK